MASWSTRPSFWRVRTRHFRRRNNVSSTRPQMWRRRGSAQRTRRMSPSGSKKSVRSSRRRIKAVFGADKWIGKPKLTPELQAVYDSHAPSRALVDSWREMLMSVAGRPQLEHPACELLKQHSREARAALQSTPRRGDTVDAPRGHYIDLAEAKRIHLEKRARQEEEEKQKEAARQQKAEERAALKAAKLAAKEAAKAAKRAAKEAVRSAREAAREEKKKEEAAARGQALSRRRRRRPPQEASPDCRRRRALGQGSR